MGINEIEIKSYNITIFIDNWLASQGFIQMYAIISPLYIVVFALLNSFCYVSLLGNRSKLNYIWERVWYLSENAPLALKGEAWVFYKNGTLLISSIQKNFKDITNTYTWKYNPKMNSIIIFSKNRTQIFTNIEVKEINGIQLLTFTSILPYSTYSFSPVIALSDMDILREAPSSQTLI